MVARLRGRGKFWEFRMYYPGSYHILRQIVKLFYGIYLRIIACCRLHDNYSRQFSCSPSWTYFESKCDGLKLSSDLRYLQISLEPLKSTLHGTDHASDITEMIVFKRWMWHKNISGILLLPSQLYLESECNGLSSDLQYGISRSHLNHRRQLLKRLHSRDGCGNITYQTFSFFPSSMFEERMWWS